MPHVFDASSTPTFPLMARLAAAAALAALAACGGADEKAAAAAETAAGEDVCADAPAGAVTAVDAWARAAPAGRSVSAAYMVLCNRTDADVSVVAAAFDGADAVELHETTRDAAGKAAMARVEEIVAPAGGAARLAPGGAHVMLMALTAPLAPGDAAPLSLTLADGTQIPVDAAVLSMEDARKK
ncbi:MAG: copper chaperone PCu(A)C [Pseudomonadota bacterium]